MFSARLRSMCTDSMRCARSIQALLGAHLSEEVLLSMHLLHCLCGNTKLFSPGSFTAITHSQNALTSRQYTISPTKRFQSTEISEKIRFDALETFSFPNMPAVRISDSCGYADRETSILSHDTIPYSHNFYKTLIAQKESNVGVEKCCGVTLLTCS